jgi:integrase
MGLRERCPAASHDREQSRLRKNVIATRLGAVPVRHLTSARVDDHLHELERAGAAPASVNHVRAKLRTVFFKAKKAGLWAGPNPILETESRSVPKRVHPTLKADEIALLLSCVPSAWRAFTATAIFAGLRKGKLCGLQKADVDLDAAVITVRRSYDNETTKGGHADMVPIAPALKPYLRDALDESSSDLVFPWSDGSMRSPECDPERSSGARWDTPAWSSATSTPADAARAAGRRTWRNTKTQSRDVAQPATRSCGPRRFRGRCVSTICGTPQPP